MAGRWISTPSICSGFLRRAKWWVATFDRRGFGASPLEPDFARELDDLSKVTRALPGRVIVYGVSQGARLALRAAAPR